MIRSPLTNDEVEDEDEDEEEEEERRSRKSDSCVHLFLCVCVCVCVCVQLRSIAERYACGAHSLILSCVHAAPAADLTEAPPTPTSVRDCLWRSFRDNDCGGSNAILRVGGHDNAWH